MDRYILFPYIVIILYYRTENKTSISQNVIQELLAFESLAKPWKTYIPDRISDSTSPHRAKNWHF